MELNNRKLIPHESIFVIAETASSHEGDLNLALEMADAANTTGADAIKYQMLKADSLLVPNHHKCHRLEEIEFSDAEWSETIEHARSLGLLVIGEIFDEESFELAQKLDVAIFKIPTSDLTNPDLLPRVAASMKPIILSVGAATEEEIDFAVTTCEEVENKSLILMHGFQSFPTRIEDTNFRLLEFLKSKYDYDLGFADHIDAESELASFLPLVAMGYGVSVIEKHITLDRSLKGRDYYSALNPEEFERMVSLIRDIEKAFGGSEFGQSSAEIEYRQLMKKMVVAARDIPEGARITNEDICFRRTDEKGMGAVEYERLLGRANRLIPKYSTIKEEDVI